MARSLGWLPMFCQFMSGSSQLPMSSSQRLPSGGVIERHQHYGAQLVYVATGVLVVETEHGSWVASSDRAIWLPPLTWHRHRAFGTSTIRTLGFEAQGPPLDTQGQQSSPSAR